MRRGRSVRRAALKKGGACAIAGSICAMARRAKISRQCRCVLVETVAKGTYWYNTVCRFVVMFRRADCLGSVRSVKAERWAREMLHLICGSLRLRHLLRAMTVSRTSWIGDGLDSVIRELVPRFPASNYCVVMSRILRAHVIDHCDECIRFSL